MCVRQAFLPYLLCHAAGAPKHTTACRSQNLPSPTCKPIQKFSTSIPRLFHTTSCITLLPIVQPYSIRQRHSYIKSYHLLPHQHAWTLTRFPESSDTLDFTTMVQFAGHQTHRYCSRLSRQSDHFSDKDGPGAVNDEPIWPPRTTLPPRQGSARQARPYFSSHSTAAHRHKSDS